MLYFYLVVISLCLGPSLSIEANHLPLDKFVKSEKKKEVGAYDEDHPYYLKYCSMSRIHPKKKYGKPGGTPGHAALYIKGACLQTQKGPSRLKICEENEDFSNPDLGVGISTNKYLENVNFVSVPGQKMFFGTGLLVDEKFTWEAKEKIKSLFIEENILDNITFHKNKKKASDISDEVYYSENMFGTDYAISLARNLYCINIPTTREITKVVVKELNKLNDSYKGSKGKRYRGGSKKDNFYHWHGIHDNCAHTINNLLSVLGIIGEKKINQNLFEQLGQIAIPSNLLYSLNKKLNKKPLLVEKYYKNENKRKMFLDYQWIPQQEGVLMQKIGFYENNDVFLEDDTMLTLPDAFMKKTKKIRGLMTEGHLKFYKEGDSYKGELNLSFYQEKYMDAIIDARTELERLKSKRNMSSEDQQYYSFIESFLKKLINRSLNVV